MTYTAVKRDVPGYTGEEHPEIVDIRAMPKQPDISKPGQVPENQIRQFFEEGYIQIDKFFNKEDIDPCREAIVVLVDNLAEKLYRGGKVKSLYKECGFYTRLAKLEQDFPGANILLHKNGILPEQFQTLWSNEKLLNLMEQLLGPDISGMPSWSLRCKTPRTEAATVPWHQDAAYTSVDAYKTLIVTVWIPFVDTSEKNGCLELIPSGHLKGKVGMHQGCVGDTWYVSLPEDELETNLGGNLNKSKICSVPYGGILVFSNFLPHRSLENYSDDIRWTIDLRFKKTGLPNGMHGLKKDIILRSSENPEMKIDWTSFATNERLKLKLNPDGSVTNKPKEDEFDTTIGGPWIKKWELVHPNRHTDKALAEA